MTHNSYGGGAVIYLGALGKLTFDDFDLSSLRPVSVLDVVFLVTCTLGTGGRFSLEGDLTLFPPVRHTQETKGLQFCIRQNCTGVILMITNFDNEF